MKSTGVRTLVLAAFVCALFTTAPLHAFAATQSAVTGILPPGSMSCPTVGVSEVVPFVYDGHLDSFEVSVTDRSYVAVGAQVGDTPVDFHYLTRRINPDGTLRIHVDIASMPVVNDLPIQITLLSSRPDIHVTCALHLAGIVSRGTVIPQVPTAPATPPSPYVPSTGTSHPVSSGYPTVPSSSGQHYSQGNYGPIGHPGSNTGSVGSTSSTSTVKTPPAAPGTVFVGALHSLGSVCTKTSSWKLWTILLVLYLLFVLALALQMPETLTDGSRGWNIALIIILLFALLGLWYLSAACRAGPWAPVIAILLALVGIRALMRKPESMPPVILIEKK